MLYKKKEVAKAVSEKKQTYSVLTWFATSDASGVAFLFSMIVHHNGDKIATIVSLKIH